MKRRNFLTALAVVPAVLSLDMSAPAAKEESTAYTITETEDLLILSGIISKTNFDCKGKKLYLKGFYKITFCQFTNIKDWCYECHPGSSINKSTLSFIDTGTEEA